MKAHARVLGQGKDTVGSNDAYLLKHIAPVKKTIRSSHLKYSDVESLGFQFSINLVVQL